MDQIDRVLKYRLERRIQKFLEDERSKYFKLKWIGEQSTKSKKIIVNNADRNIKLIDKKIVKQLEKIEIIASGLSKKSIKNIDESLEKEWKENQEFFIGRSSDLSRETLETELDLEEIEKESTEEMVNEK